MAEVNALLYSPNHAPDQLQRALRIGALSPGWRTSFQALLDRQGTGTGTGNAGLAPAAAAHPSAPGFRPVVVTTIDQESADVLSLSMQSTDGQPLAAALPGQYVVLRLQTTASVSPIFRSYSVSGPHSTERYRISVKIEPNGLAGAYLQGHVRLGHTLDVSSPRGSFVLESGERPLVLLSAGIGATPVLAMLHTLAATRSMRQVLWIHTSRDREHHPFALEVRRLISALPHGATYICYSRPGPSDKIGEDFDASGHLSQAMFREIALPPDSDVYLCGPLQFMADMKEALAICGVATDRIHAEVFNGSESMTPGVVNAEKQTPHAPKDDADTGPLISFARTGVAAHWQPSRYQSILELAEACDVPVRWSCRNGVCHSCESGLVSGTVVYCPEPLERPADGNLLICCAQPVSDLVLDL